MSRTSSGSRRRATALRRPNCTRANEFAPGRAWSENPTANKDWLADLTRGQIKDAESFAVAALRISEAIAREPGRSADVGEGALVLAPVQANLDRAVEALENGLGRDHALAREALALEAALRK